MITIYTHMSVSTTHADSIDENIPLSCEPSVLASSPSAAGAGAAAASAPSPAAAAAATAWRSLCDFVLAVRRFRC